MAKKEEKKIIKVIYFDEDAAADYVAIQNGGQIDWTTTENKEKLAAIIGEIEAQAKGGFQLIPFLKATLSGQTTGKIDASTSKIINTTVSNTLLTDYIKLATKDKNIKQFHDDGVYAPENSVSMYKMYSSYLNIVPKEEIPIDLEGLNNAILGERGYYQMLLNSQEEPTCVLRFNIKAFKNNYSLADLSKMSLSYYGIKVGKCTKEQLSLDKEFETKNTKSTPTATEIVQGEIKQEEVKLDIYDIVLAGVMSNE